MKKIAILAIVLCCVSAAYSQDTLTNTPQEQIVVNKPEKDCARHRILVYYGMGYANSIYDGINKSFLHKNYSFSSALEVRYAYFFAPKWGISLGAGISNFAAKGTLNITGVIPNYDDQAFDPDRGSKFYDLHYKADDMIERQQVWALIVPLQFHFEHRINGNHGIFASLGAKGYFPIISARSKFPQGEGALRMSGWEEFTHAYYTDLPHFGEKGTKAIPSTAKLRPSVDIIADFGGIFRMNRICDFYAGVYGSYGFLDVLPKAENKKDFITSEPNNNAYNVNSLLASDFAGEYNQYVENNNLDWKKAKEKWNRWEVGVKVGFHIKPGCGAKKPQKSMRESKKDFYDNFSGDNGNNTDKNPIIIRDTTIQNTYYIYNASANYKEDGSFTPSERESIQKIINAFSNIKILFDLDSDEPRIDNKPFITEVAKILQSEPSLNLIIEGYTCDLGSENHNRDLAIRRAGAIRDLFIQQGVHSSRIEIAGYTASDPENKFNIKAEPREEHRAVIFRIIKGK